jgi:hypothetical protein
MTHSVRPVKMRVTRYMFRRDGWVLTRDGYERESLRSWPNAE